MTRNRLVLVVVALALAVGAVGAGVRLKQVHDYGWEWTLAPSDAPPKVVYEGRDYERGGTRAALPEDEVAAGKTMGGGAIYAQPESGTPVVIFVMTGEGRVWTYGWLGGP